MKLRRFKNRFKEYEGYQQLFQTARYYNGQVAGTSVSAVALTADTLYAIPFLVNKTNTFDRISIDVTAAAAAGKKARLGIYQSNTATQLPGTLLLDAGEVAVDAIATVEITISQALSAGLYYLAVVSDGTPTLQANAAASATAYLGAATPNACAQASRLTRSHTYAALPATYGTPTYAVGSSGFVFLRST
jgi:hypothetical protein